MTLTNESDLLRCFREIDRDEVELAPELAFPLAVDDVLAWTVGGRAYLVFRDREAAPPRGIVFHRNTSAVPDAVTMCEWCHAVRGRGAVKLMSVRTSERKRVGLYLCGDLGCVRRAHEVPSTDDVPERLDYDERARRALIRIREFAARRVF